LIKDFENINSLIRKIYEKEIYYGDFNKLKINYVLNSYEAFAYFTARLMYYINLNIENEIEYITENKIYIEE